MRIPSGGLWRNHDFLKLWSAQSVSVIGTLLGALQFTAILTLDAGPRQMSILTAASVLSALVLGVFAGAWVDRLRRRPILVAADSGRMALLASIPVAWGFDALRIEQLYGVAFFHGSLTMFFDVAYRSYLPSLVSQDELVEANAKLSASAAVAEVGAFSLGGWLVQVFSAIAVAAVDAASFFVSGLLLAWIRRPETEPKTCAERPGMAGEILGRVRMVVGNPVLRAIGASEAAMGLGGGVFGALSALWDRHAWVPARCPRVNLRDWRRFLDTWSTNGAAGQSSIRNREDSSCWTPAVRGIWVPDPGGQGAVAGSWGDIGGTATV
jgi:MFS family permease